ncbi:unnamed protein product, partial [Closterium sp. NIES-54]
RLFPYRCAPPPPPPLFLATNPLQVDPLPPQGPAPSGVSQVDPLLGTAPVEVAVGSGAAPGAASGGAVSGGAEPSGAGSDGAESWGAEPGGAEPGGADPSGGPVLAHSSTVLPCHAALSGLMSGLHLPSFSTNLVSGDDLQDTWVDQFTPGGQRVTHCTCSRTGRHLATFPRWPGSSLYTLTTVSPPVTASGQVAASSQVFVAAGGEFSSDLLRAFCCMEGIRRTFTLPASPQQNGIAERRIGMVMDYAAHQINLQPRVSLPETTPTLQWTGKVGDASVLRGPAPSGVSQEDSAELVEVAVNSGAARGAEPTGAGTGGAGTGGAEPERVEPGGAEPGGALGVPSRREPLSPQQLREWYSRGCEGAAGAGAACAVGAGCSGGSADAGAAGATGDPGAEGTGSDSAVSGGAARPRPPAVTRSLAIAVTDPLFESTAASALVAELVDFAAACLLDYATSLVAESASVSVCPPSVGGECALGTDVLEDGQEEFECFATSVPRLVSMLIASEGDPDAPDIPTLRSYAEVIEGPYSSQWQAAMDAKMASWKSTGTYVDEVPPPGANIVGGIWIFRVKRPPGSPPVFKARYVARGFTRVVLTGHADASRVDDLATQRSSQGYAFSLGSGFVSWRSTCSSFVLSSSCEAEIYAGAMAAQELRWLTYLLTDLVEAPRSPPILYVDNKAMLALCQEHRTKHIALLYFLARELQQPGQLRLAYVASQANTADVFTKALQHCDHQHFCSVLGLVPTVPHLLTS